MPTLQRTPLESLTNGVLFARNSSTDPTLHPIAGASVYIYQHGTTTQVAVYSAETGTTALTQPLSSNVDGSLPGWVTPFQSLDLEVVAAAGIVVPVTFTVDALGQESFNARTGAIVPAAGDYTAAQVTGAEATANKGAANGYAPLDASQLVPAINSRVQTVFGRAGAVVATAGDYLAAQVTNAADKASTVLQAFAAPVSAPGFRASEAANGKQGVATLVAGTVTIANTSITANSRILISPQEGGVLTGFLRVSARTVGTSFVVSSSVATDTVTFAFEILEPA